MEINTLYFFAAFGIGLSVELLLQSNPSIYQKSIYVGKAVIVAGVIALMPPVIIRYLFFGFLIAKAGDLTGGYLLRAVTWIAVKIEAKKWDIDQNRKDTNQDNSS